MSNQIAILHDLLGVKPKTTEPTLTLAYSVQKGLPVSALDRVAGRVTRTMSAALRTAWCQSQRWNAAAGTRSR
jgi:hypothetical protein